MKETKVSAYILDSEELEEMVETYMRRQIIDFTSIRDIAIIHTLDGKTTLEVLIRRQDP